jgi:hypothetical protein
MASRFFVSQLALSGNLSLRSDDLAMTDEISLRSVLKYHAGNSTDPFLNVGDTLVMTDNLSYLITNVSRQDNKDGSADYQIGLDRLFTSTSGSGSKGSSKPTPDFTGLKVDEGAFIILQGSGPLVDPTKQKFASGMVGQYITLGGARHKILSITESASGQTILLGESLENTLRIANAGSDLATAVKAWGLTSADIGRIVLIDNGYYRFAGVTSFDQVPVLPAPSPTGDQQLVAALDYPDIRAKVEFELGAAGMTLVQTPGAGSRHYLTRNDLHKHLFIGLQRYEITGIDDTVANKITVTVAGAALKGAAGDKVNATLDSSDFGAEYKYSTPRLRVDGANPLKLTQWVYQYDKTTRLITGADVGSLITINNSQFIITSAAAKLETSSPIFTSEITVVDFKGGAAALSLGGEYDGVLNQSQLRASYFTVKADKTKLIQSSTESGRLITAANVNNALFIDNAMYRIVAFDVSDGTITLDKACTPFTTGSPAVTVAIGFLLGNDQEVKGTFSFDTTDKNIIKLDPTKDDALILAAKVNDKVWIGNTSYVILSIDEIKNTITLDKTGTGTAVTVYLLNNDPAIAGIQGHANIGPVGADVVADGSVTATLAMILGKESATQFFTLKRLTEIISSKNLGALFKTAGAQPSLALSGNLDARLYVDGLPSQIFLGGEAGQTSLSFNGEFDSKTNAAKAIVDYGLNPALNSLKDIDIQSIIRLILDNLPKLMDVLLQSGMGTTIPFVNKSINDLASLKEDVQAAVERLRQEDVHSLQALSSIIEKTLGLKSGALVITLDTSETSHVKARFTLKYESFFNKSLAFDTGKLVTEFGGLGGIEGMKGSANLNATGSLNALLDFGFIIKPDAKDTTPIDFWVYGDTGVGADIKLEAKNVNFNLGLGKIGLMVRGGKLEITGAVSGKLGDVTGVGAGISIGNLLSKNVAFELDGTIDGELPVFFPSETHGLGSIYIDGWKDRVGATPGVRTELASLKDLKNVNPVLVEDGKVAGLYIPRNDDPTKGPIVPDPTVIPSGDAGNHILIDIAGVLAEFNNVFKDYKLNIFDKIGLALDGVDTFLGVAQDTINTDLKNKALPVVGKAFANGANVIESFRADFLEKLRGYVAEAGALYGKKGVEKIAQQIFRTLSELDPKFVKLDSFNSGRFDLDIQKNGAKQKSGTISAAGQGLGYVYYFDDADASKDYAQWNFTLSGDYTVGKDIAFALGVPGISLDADGKVGVTIHWSLDLGFGIDNQRGFYIALDHEYELNRPE